MPPVCENCKEIGHNVKRCPKILKVCGICNSSAHGSGQCSQAKPDETKGKKTRRGRSKSKGKVWAEVPLASKDAARDSNVKVVANAKPVLGLSKDFDPGESSSSALTASDQSKQKEIVLSGEVSSDVAEDSSDIPTSESDVEEGQILEINTVSKELPNKQRSGAVGTGGKGPKKH
ncbi:uncharacterized protein LOC112083947 [Eutrema salsugineum]|uniref:uncharacterized protein LOC112083947 n=1 Tax=Eutrema salsugineum TaxID=72664 RepID=UPI000CED231C|nr:uncharacterized protein LOC112083947 [Eutrema salsugineum]